MYTFGLNNAKRCTQVEVVSHLQLYTNFTGLTECGDIAKLWNQTTSCYPCEKILIQKSRKILDTFPFYLKKEMVYFSVQPEISATLIINHVNQGSVNTSE